jgi:hypothetical protein
MDHSALLNIPLLDNGKKFLASASAHSKVLTFSANCCKKGNRSK